jgi:dipeptidyl aminopeptidase/acylaminoacyl peptidase
MNVRRAGLALGMLAIAALALSARPDAQARRPMTLVSLAEIPRVQDIQLSPDGRFVSYMLARADWTANRQITHVWRQAVTGGSPLQLTTGEAGESLARWSPDSRTLLFLTGGQICLVAADGGAPRQLTHHATNVYGGTAPAWSPDGASIYFLASDSPPDVERERERLRDDLFVFEQNYKQRHLWKVTVATGVEQQLTDGAFSVLSFRLSKDGTRIAEHRAPTPLPGDVNRGDVWVSDVTGLNARAITSNSIEENEAELSPDNTQLLFLAEANQQFEPYYSSALFVVSTTGGTPTLVLSGFPYAIEHAAWAPDGKAVLAVVNMGAHSEVFRIDIATHAAKALTDGRHSVQFWSVTSAAGRMVFQFDEPNRLGDGWTLPVDGGTPTRVTGVYDSLDSEFALPRQEKISWKGVDGVAVEGLLFYPIGYEAGKRYPLVVQLHGGPQESDKFGYGPGVIVNYVPVLASKGYAVLRPNYRGSSGYGSAFLRDVVGSYFKNMHLDVMAGVDALVARGIADPDRLAVMGWSAGGHLTNKLITFTNRFKAASSAAGAANWTSFFAETDTRANRSAWFEGLPWGKNAPVDAFWNNSPLKDAANVRTPTLLFAGEADARVPFPQAVEMFRALTANGVATRLYAAPREPHQWGELRHQLSKANAELEWFERHVMGRGYAWERAPGDPAEAGISAIRP